MIARLLNPVLALLVLGCAANDLKSSAGERSSHDGAADAKACQSIRSTLQARAPGSLSVLSVLCHNDLVVIAGALPPDYKPAVEAVHIATKPPGVRRVATFFVPKPAQDTSDSAIASRIRIALAGDPDASAAGTDLTVVAGTVVLVDAVDDQPKADRIIASAGSVAGVKSGKSFIRLKP